MNTTLNYCPVGRMLPGDRFLTNRSGWVTVMSMPYPDPDGGTAQCIEVRRDDDGGTFGLVGVNVYTVTRPDHVVVQP